MRSHEGSTRPCVSILSPVARVLALAAALACLMSIVALAVGAETVPDQSETTSAHLPIVWQNQPPRLDEPVLEMAALKQGPGLDFVWRDDLVYRTEGSQLVIVDVSDPTVFREIGRTAPLDGLARAIDLDGDTAFVAVKDAGLAAVDVSDPLLPVVLWHRQTRGVAQDIVAESGYVHVASDEGIATLDVHDIEEPKWVGVTAKTPGGVHLLEFNAGHLFALQEYLGQMFIYSVDAWGRRLEVSRFDAELISHLAFHGSYVVLCGDFGAFQIIDASDPSSPKQIAVEIGQPGWITAVTVEGGRLYMIGGADTDTRDTTLWTWDLTTTNIPRLLAADVLRDSTDRPLHRRYPRLQARQDTILAQSGSDAGLSGLELTSTGFLRISVSPPAARVQAVERGLGEIGAVRRDGASLYLLDLTFYGRTLFEPGPGLDGLMRYDIDVDGTLLHRGFVDLPGLLDFVVRDGVAYAVQQTADGVAFFIYDVSGWPTARKLGMAVLPESCKYPRIRVSHDRAYVAGAIEQVQGPFPTTLTTVDVAAPTAPRVVATHTLSVRSWSDFDADGERIFAVYRRAPGFAEFHVDDQGGVSESAVLEPLARSVVVRDGIAYAASHSELHTVDVTTPGAPHALSTVGLPRPEDEPVNEPLIEVSNGVAFVSSGPVMAVDVSDPAHLLPIGAVTEPFAFNGPTAFLWRGMAARNGTAYAVGEYLLDSSLGIGVFEVRR